MTRTASELAQTERLNAAYDTWQSPVMQAICNEVCCCGYVGSSWATRDEAEALVRQLRLAPKSRLLELGAGAGWPGLFLACRSGCSAVLVDLPEVGLKIAKERAAADGMAGRVKTLVADASDLPFGPSSFDAINHSDLLCCLEAKRDVLAMCRHVCRPDGRMAFTVISVAPGLSPARRRRAIDNAPEFVDSAEDYPTMLAATGWDIVERHDLTGAYFDACKRQISADEREETALRALIGAREYDERLANWRGKLSAISDRLTMRELFVAVPKV